MIRKAFPQTNPVLFKKPNVETVEKLLSTVEGLEFPAYENKVDFILDALDKA